RQGIDGLCLAVVATQGIAGEAVKIPPSAAVGNEEEDAAGRPFRLKNRFRITTGHLDLLGDSPIAGKAADPQLRSVPRHVRMMPFEPGQPGSVRTDAW